VGVWNDAELVDLNDECGLLPAWGGDGGEVDYPVEDGVRTRKMGIGTKDERPEFSGHRSWSKGRRTGGEEPRAKIERGLGSGGF
jgi:hypothetical protein